MSGAPSAATAPRRRDGALGRLARAIVAPLVSGAVGAIIFLVMIQGSFRRGHTTLDFNHVLGTMIAGDVQATGATGEALGVVGDSVGPAGLWGTIVAGIALMVVHELVVTRLVPGPWFVRAVPLAALTILAVGVLFTALADARFDTPIGLFGVDAGGITPLVIVLCSVGFALTAARAHDLASRAWWWEERPDPLADARLEDAWGVRGGGPPAD